MLSSTMNPFFFLKTFRFHGQQISDTTMWVLGTSRDLTCFKFLRQYILNGKNHWVKKVFPDIIVTIAYKNYLYNKIVRYRFRLEYLDPDQKEELIIKNLILRSQDIFDQIENVLSQTISLKESYFNGLMVDHTHMWVAGELIDVSSTQFLNSYIFDMDTNSVKKVLPNKDIAVRYKEHLYNKNRHFFDFDKASLIPYTEKIINELNNSLQMRVENLYFEGEFLSKYRFCISGKIVWINSDEFLSDYIVDDTLGCFKKKFPNIPAVRGYLDYLKRDKKAHQLALYDLESTRNYDEYFKISQFVFENYIVGLDEPINDLTKYFNENNTPFIKEIMFDRLVNADNSELMFTSIEFRKQYIVEEDDISLKDIFPSHDVAYCYTKFLLYATVPGAVEYDADNLAHQTIARDKKFTNLLVVLKNRFKMV